MSSDRSATLGSNRATLSNLSSEKWRSSKKSRIRRRVERRSRERASELTSSGTRGCAGDAKRG
jgi:hypothetical protein